jgi:acylpyruvate hydrolase
MRLATLAAEGGTTRAAVLRGDRAATVGGFADVGELLRAGDAGLDAARAAAEAEGEPFAPEALRRPVLAPAAVVCVGQNYRAHILEMGHEVPTSPTLFSKLARALTDPGVDVELPAPSEKVDYEGELAVVVGRGGRDIPAERAWEHVGGLTLLNDVSARDFQRRTPQWFAGKTFQRSTPVGPVVVTPDELGELGAHVLETRVNGEERQRASLGDLVFDVPTLVADLSRIVELEPGDLIATGTPGGVGDPTGRYLQDGDVVEVVVGAIGVLRNRFVRA